MKKKIVICLTSNYYKKYFDFDAFNILEKKYDVTYLLNKKNFNLKIPQKKKFAHYKTTDYSDIKYMRFIHLSMIVNKNKSKTFQYQFRRWYPNFKDFFQQSMQNNFETKRYSNYFFFILFTIINYLRKPLFRRLRIKFLSFQLIFNFYKKNIIDKYPIDLNIYSVIKKINPDLILYPSHCFEPETIKLTKISKKIGSKIIFIIDNWDNLSSKTVFLENPDAITVWGKQSAIHANKIHKIKKKNIFLLGSPKFDYYFKIQKNKFKKIFNFDYVLFLGILQPYNEIAALKVIDVEISSNPELYRNLKLVYRPHPGREYLIHKAYREKFKNIIFDPRMKNYVISRNKKFLISCKNYYESLLSNSLFMVGGLTTVVLESIIFNKKYLFLAYPEKYNLTDPKKMYENYAHYNEISKISYLSKCCDINDLSKDFRNLFRNYYQNKKNVISELSYFYDISKTGYSQKLYNITKKVLETKIV